ncbi:MAG: glycosyltransferase family 4 protein [bacterium]
MKKIRLLHIITHLAIGGAQDNTLLTLEKLDKNKYDITLLCGKSGQWIQRAHSIPDIKIIFINELIRKIHCFYDIIALIKIFFYIKKNKFSLVHTHSSKAGFSGRIAAKMAGVPVIIHTIHGFPFHDYMNPVKKIFFIILERLLAKISTKLITVSKLNLKKALDLKIDQDNKFVNIYSGIEFEKFEKRIQQRKIRNNLNIDDNIKVISLIGRLSKQKAPQYLLKAVPEIISQYPDVLFLLVGDGELKKYLIKLTKKLNIIDKVLFLGFRKDIPEILQITDIFVLTSLWEGLGRSLTEAMYMGKPVIATRVEGVPEIVQHEKTGLLVKPKDYKGVATSINKLLGNPRFREKLGKNAHALVAKKFSAEKMVKAIDSVYQKII